MKIALLHGAVLNAGDYLIAERTQLLLKHFYPDCEIECYVRNLPLEDKLEAINKCDIVILAGGPCYNASFSKQMPFMSYFEKINRPIMMVGCGWWAADARPEVIYNFKFDDRMLAFLKRVEADSKILGCRDFYSVDVLAANGIYSGAMTGCPAWYHLPSVGKEKFTGAPLDRVKKICISDCANTQLKGLEATVAQYLRKTYGPNVEIVYVNHRDYRLDKLGLESVYEQNNIKLVDISGSAEGFKIYDDCDLHVGFRVHAHIYNMSRRQASVLIEEDSRGAGVNDALGLPHIQAFRYAVADGKLATVINEYSCDQVGDAVVNHIMSKYVRLENAYTAIDKYFEEMTRQIMSIKDII